MLSDAPEANRVSVDGFPPAGRKKTRHGDTPDLLAVSSAVIHSHTAYSSTPTSLQLFSGDDCSSSSVLRAGESHRLSLGLFSVCQEGSATNREILILSAEGLKCWSSRPADAQLSAG